MKKLLVLCFVVCVSIAVAATTVVTISQHYGACNKLSGFPGALQTVGLLGSPSWCALVNGACVLAGCEGTCVLANNGDCKCENPNKKKGPGKKK